MKRGFTLIELLISITILVLLVFTLYSTLETVNRSNQRYEIHANSNMQTRKLQTTFFDDFTQSLTSQIFKLENVHLKSDKLLLQTAHSHFDISMPFVTYILRDKKLFRIESLIPITDFNEEILASRIKLEVVMENVKTFKIFSSANYLLISVNDICFEIAK